MEIKGFYGDYRFLSNHYKSDILFDGERYPTVENAFHASKCNKEHRGKFTTCSSYEAKLLSYKMEVDQSWVRQQHQIMHTLVTLKFSEPDLRKRLLETGPHTLIYSNSLNDTYWGVGANGEGENHLGKLLQEVRNELIDDNLDTSTAYDDIPKVLISNRRTVENAIAVLAPPKEQPSETFAIPTWIDEENEHLGEDPNYILTIDDFGKRVRIYCQNKSSAQELEKTIKRCAVLVDVTSTSMLVPVPNY